MPTLVVIVGPIASGKSTTARALGKRLRASGRRVAVVDVDELVETIGGFVDLPGELFRQAQLVFGMLVGAWLDQGFDVIAHGPFFDKEEDEALVHALPDGVAPRRVLLHSSYEVALERIRADPERMLSSYPDFLKATYDRVNELLPTMLPAEWTFDTTTTDTQTIVNDLVEALL
ncbi:MAG: AAA family ATPase [Acidimicrobiales bacterium]